jgi:hypothetical protein
VVARTAFEHGGAGALQAFVRQAPGGGTDDEDLRPLLLFGRPGRPTAGDRAALEQAARKGSSAAAFALGRLALRGGEVKLASRWLERTVAAGQGDACAAAGELKGLLPASGRAVWVSGPTPVLKALRARNTGCVHLAGAAGPAAP